MKELFVAQVLDRLRELARREALLLFRERRHHPGASLPDLSMRVSRVILRATDAIEAALPGVSAEDRALLDGLIAEHVPEVLLEHAGDRLQSELPPAYLSGLVAATLATMIVYREGLGFLADLDPGALADLALRYLREEQSTQKLVALVTESTLPDRARIARIVQMAGSRTALLMSRSQVRDRA